MDVMNKVAKGDELAVMQDTWAELKQSFVIDAQIATAPKHLIVAVLLPTGATEIIHNTEQLDSKMRYYIDQYDDKFRLKANPNVRIVDYMIV